jgi:hypothetical protein
MPRCSLLWVLPVAACLGAATPCRAQADSPDAKPARIKNLSTLNEKKVTLTVADSSVRDALNALFEKVELNRCVFFDAGGRGLLNFSVKDVPFEGALVSILRGTRRNQYRYEDFQEMLLVHPGLIPGMPVDRSSLRVSMDLKDVDVKWAIKALLQGISGNYTLDQYATGTVTVSFDYLNYDQAFEKVLHATSKPLVWEVENGVYRFHLKGSGSR